MNNEIDNKLSRKLKIVINLGGKSVSYNVSNEAVKPRAEMNAELIDISLNPSKKRKINRDNEVITEKQTDEEIIGICLNNIIRSREYSQYGQDIQALQCINNKDRKFYIIDQLCKHLILKKEFGICGDFIQAILENDCFQLFSNELRRGILRNKLAICLIEKDQREEAQGILIAEADSLYNHWEKISTSNSLDLYKSNVVNTLGKIYSNLCRLYFEKKEYQTVIDLANRGLGLEFISGEMKEVLGLNKRYAKNMRTQNSKESNSSRTILLSTPSENGGFNELLGNTVEELTNDEIIEIYSSKLIQHKDFSEIIQLLQRLSDNNRKFVILDQLSVSLIEEKKFEICKNLINEILKNSDFLTCFNEFQIESFRCKLVICLVQKYNSYFINNRHFEIISEKINSSRSIQEIIMFIKTKLKDSLKIDDRLLISQLLFDISFWIAEDYQEAEQIVLRIVKTLRPSNIRNSNILAQWYLRQVLVLQTQTNYEWTDIDMVYKKVLKLEDIDINLKSKISNVQFYALMRKIKHYVSIDEVSVQNDYRRSEIIQEAYTELKRLYIQESKNEDINDNQKKIWAECKRKVKSIEMLIEIEICKSKIKDAEKMQGSQKERTLEYTNAFNRIKENEMITNLEKSKLFNELYASLMKIGMYDEAKKIILDNKEWWKSMDLNQRGELYYNLVVIDQMQGELVKAKVSLKHLKENIHLFSEELKVKIETKFRDLNESTEV